MGIDVVTSDKVGLLAVDSQARAKFFAKELAQDGDAEALGRCSGAGCWFYAKARNTGSLLPRTLRHDLANR